MYRRSKTILISGIITIIATIIILLLFIKDWPGVTGLAVAAIIWSEMAFFGGLIFVEWLSKKCEQIIVRSAVYFIILAYSSINILISIIFMMVLKWFTNSFIVIELVLLTISIIMLLVSVTAGSSIAESNASTMGAVTDMGVIVGRLDKLANNPECREFSSTIKKLSDDLRFTYNSKKLPEDIEIDKAVEELEILAGDRREAIHEKMNKKLVHLNTLIANRKIATQIMQRGKI